jgi:hypothetical protein
VTLARVRRKEGREKGKETYLKPVWKVYILYEFNYQVFCKRQN